MSAAEPSGAAGVLVPGYTLLDELGGGGMGVVYLAMQDTLERHVAIKLLRPQLRGDARTHERFCVEARAASRLNHPSSVAIIDFGITPDGVPYLVMEHLPGTDLASLVEAEGALTQERVCRIALCVLGALAEAHGLGIVHRDLKPDNVILVPRRNGVETVKVVDFGLAQIPAESGRRTEPGMTLGTPHYMAPEQFGDVPVDGRADLYSLGVMMFELCTGETPFDGRSAMELARHHFLTPPPDPRSVAPERRIDGRLAELIVRAMAKEPGDRFASADAMAAALRGVAQSITGARASGTCCGSCGARLRDEAAWCPLCGAAAALPAGGMPEPAVTGRALAELEACRARVAGQPRVVGVRGAPGAGKTSLLERYGESAARLGDRVARAGAHPLRAPVAYFPVRAAITQLVQRSMGEGGLGELRDLVVGAEDRAGLSELLSPGGGGATLASERARAVAAAVAAAARIGAAHAKGGGVVLLFDDADEYDALSVEVLRELRGRLAGVPALVVVAARDPAELGADFHLDEVLALEPAPGELSPLHERLVYGAGAAGQGEAPSLEDALAMAVERLDPSARALAQAVAVLGERAPEPALEALAGPIDPGLVESLTRAGLLDARPGEVRMHPMIREIIEASIPAGVRRALHERALSWHEEQGSSIEVRAEHAVRGADPELALLLLDQVGQLARRGGDLAAATASYRRALDLSRRELRQSGEEHFGRAIVSFSRSLAEALRAAGRDAEADGVLTEAVDEAPPESRQRAEMLVVLGRIALGKGQYEKALAAARDAGRTQAARAEPELLAETERLASDAGRGLGGPEAPEAQRPQRPRLASAPGVAPVLVVEDDPHTQETLRGILEDEGYEVHCASNGDHALRVLSRIPRPCGILVDLMMPVMNGWDLLAALRESSAYADIPVAVISAVAQRGPADARRLSKPISLDALLDTIADFRTRAQAVVEDAPPG